MQLQNDFWIMRPFNTLFLIVFAAFLALLVIASLLLRGKSDKAKTTVLVAACLVTFVGYFIYKYMLSLDADYNVITANMGGLYATEDTVAATFQFQNGLVGSGSWCFVSDSSAKVDRIALSGDQGKVSFSVFTYTPISLYTTNGKEQITINNPPHVQLPLIEKVVKALRGEDECKEDCIMATSVNWVLDKILGKL